MPKGVDREALGRLMKAPTFTPTDCPNFITYKDPTLYRWYALAVAPLLLATRGGPIFTGKRIATISGDSPGEVWMVVRYPSHRAMLRMALNPYYLLVANRLRERGTARLELAFTQPRDPNSELRKHRTVLGLHVDTSDPDGFFAAVRANARQAGVAVIYESELRLSFDFLRRPRPADPNPLTYPTTAAIGGAGEAELRKFATGDAMRSLLGAQSKACAQLYERMHKHELLPFGRRAR